MQIYRHMDIGTAKPTAEEQARVPHHMTDIVDPDEPFDAARYAENAGAAVSDIVHRGKNVFVAGGTGFYIKTLIHGIFDAEPVDPDVREGLRQEAAEKGAPFLHARLGKLDPDTAQKIHPNDTYRIIRALEVYETTGETVSMRRNGHRFSETRYNALKIGLHMDRDRLYKRIDRRVDEMVAGGFADEVKRLLEMGYSKNLKSMQSIGYRHIVEFLDGNAAWDETVRTMKRDTRRYAKRQLTWFGADSEVVWTRPDDLENILNMAHRFLASP